MNVVLLLFNWHAADAFTLANMCIAICNLAPVTGSDGDRALSFIRQMHTEPGH